jgi:hypothetical protein
MDRFYVKNQIMQYINLKAIFKFLHLQNKYHSQQIISCLEEVVLETQIIFTELLFSQVMIRKL